MRKSKFYDEECELYLLSACVQVSEDQKNKTDLLMSLVKNRELFYFERNKITFDCISELYDNNITIDPITLNNKFEEKGYISYDNEVKEENRIDGLDTVFAFEVLCDYKKFTTIGSVRDYYNICNTLYKRRMLKTVGMSINEMASNSQKDIDEAYNESINLLCLDEENIWNPDFGNNAEVINDIYSKIVEASKNKKPITGTLTGFTDLDIFLNGLWGGELTVLAARPGIGKTSLALKMARNIYSRREDVIFISLEMKLPQLQHRLLSNLSLIEGNLLRRGVFDMKKVEGQIFDCSQILIEETRNLYVLDNNCVKPSQIKSSVRKLINQGKKVKAIFIDYLQLLNPGEEYIRTIDKISEITRSLKIMAMEFDIPVVLLSQLSRECEKRINSRPILSDLRDSGSIEQDADSVLFIYRDTKSKEEGERNTIQEAEIIIAKNRNGPVGTVKLMFDPKTTDFRSMHR